MAAWARWLLRCAGWRVQGTAPHVPRCVVVFAPHTSNWDFPLLLLTRSALGLRSSYLGKHTLFRPPFGWLFRTLGGIPVNRSDAHHLVAQISHEFQAREHLWLAMAPEGTRKKTDHWKSGFYWIALAARVPVLLSYIDSQRRHCGIGPLIELTGDVERDLAVIREFYADKHGLNPELAGDVRFKSTAHP